MTRSSEFKVVAALCALGIAGCSSQVSGDPANTGAADDVLAISSWWDAPGETEAMQALIDGYKEGSPGTIVFVDNDQNSDNWEERLTARIDDSPWDVVQMSASDLERFNENHPGSLAPLDEIYDDPSLEDAIIPIFDAAASVDGTHFGVVTGVHRNNSFFVNLQLFAAHGVDVPTSIEEVVSACQELKDAGVPYPFAVMYQGWALRIAFNEILASMLGPEGFAEFLAMEEPPADAELVATLTEAIDTFHMLHTECGNADLPSESGWENAVTSMMAGDSAMFFHGDWAKGYLVSTGYTPGVDFGVSGPPGAEGLFVYGADMFVLPSSATNKGTAKDFLRYVASADGQVEFNTLKGSTPMRNDVGDRLDEPGKANLQALVNADVLMRGYANPEWDAAFDAYAKDRDKEPLLEVYLSTTPAQ